MEDSSERLRGGTFGSQQLCHRPCKSCDASLLGFFLCGFWVSWHHQKRHCLCVCVLVLVLLFRFRFSYSGGGNARSRRSDIFDGESATAEHSTTRHSKMMVPLLGCMHPFGTVECAPAELAG